MARPWRPLAGLLLMLLMGRGSLGRQGALRHQSVYALPRGIPALGWDQWVFCADEFMECQCPGQIRWGAEGQWLKPDPQPGPTACSRQALGVPAEGQARNHCECSIKRGSATWFRTSPAILPEADTSQPVVSCEQMQMQAPDNPWSANLWQAVEDLCMLCPSDDTRHDKQHKSEPPGPLALDATSLQELMQVWVDPRFLTNYARVYGEDGWADRAFVNYVGNCAPGGRYDRMMEQLIRSVHLFSKHPIIVVHFGMVAPSSWDPELYSRLVLLHAKPLPQVNHWRSFNFNKYRAMLLARVRVGIELDSDEFVAPGIDALFARTAEEVTAEYPMPILPVHFLPDKGPSSGGPWWPRFCDPDGTCPRQTMRWAHAHPTWTHFALPFLGRWLRRNLLDQRLPPRQGFPDSGLRVLDVPEDEDLLNVGLWEEGATKQWCKFETPDPMDFDILLYHRLDGGVVADTRFYPDGAPLVFYSAHHAVEPDKSMVLIDSLAARSKAGQLPPPITYRGRFYKDMAEVRQDYPDLPCLI